MRLHHLGGSIRGTCSRSRRASSNAFSLAARLAARPTPCDGQASEFAALCKPTKRVSRSHLDELLKQLQSLGQLSLPHDLLDDVPPAKIDAWAEESRRLTATELREYTPARRRTMLLCLIHRTRATRLDDLVTMLARFVGRIEAKARAELEAWPLERRINVAEMVGVLHDIARLRRDQPAAPDLVVKIDAIFQQAGGLECIISACEQHLGKGAKTGGASSNRIFGRTDAGSMI